jgi:hypothetical protein
VGIAPVPISSFAAYPDPVVHDLMIERGEISSSAT